MPYTPPSQLSPTASNPSTPALTRNGSYTGTPETSTNSNQPRSTTYLHRHRRTPSVSKATAFAAPRPVVARSYNLPGLEPEASAVSRDQSAVRPSPSLHQSPPPVSSSAIPPGAIVSPPDSAQNSSDDEAGDKSEKSRRERQLDNLVELQEAIRVIDFRREGSPDGNADPGWRQPGEQRVKKLALKLTKSPMFESPTQYEPPSFIPHSGQALSKEARKISHSRSTTETSIFPIADKNTESSDSSDIDDDAYRLKKPAMVRKKSGELVKPALRPSASRRPSSMPGTPTYSKAVHFDSHLEHVRHFLQVDKPLAVSAGSSPVEIYEGDAEFPFGSDDSYLRSPPFEWEIVLPNFPRETMERRSLPVRVERVFLSNDNRILIGTVVCANLAFNKHVVARFTLDYWKTTSEVIAEYNNDVRRKQQYDGYDRFNFSIKLEDQANLEKKTLFFCVRYNVLGKEFWDNNHSFNYQVDFRKNPNPQSARNSMQGVGARARNRPTLSSQSGRPVSLPASFDDFVDSLDTRYDFSGFRKQPPSQDIGDSSNSTQRLTDTKPANGTTTSPRANRPGQAFGNRYDFGASLSAAIQAANRQPDGGGGAWVRDNVKPTSKSTSGGETAGQHDYSQSAPTNPLSEPPAFASKEMWLSNANTSSANASINNPPSTFNAEKPTIQSSSYNELLNKYCFVRPQGSR
ncbi:MAG: hypothetical protein M1840_005406 [Geoglossum simile]|nr:MAG: hypothetical protein M1840_005406 [Geoglossum simile]